MPPFATEAQVRAKFQLHDTVLVPADLIAASIAHAHTEILPRLAPGLDLEPPPGEALLGEVLLAGAHLLASLASREASTQRTLTVGGQRIEHDQRFSALLAIADRSERRAWEILAPVLAPPLPHADTAATDTTPLLS